MSYPSPLERSAIYAALIEQTAQAGALDLSRSHENELQNTSRTGAGRRDLAGRRSIPLA